MNEEQRSLLLKSSSRFPPPQGVKLSYGTAGFRADASILESTVYKVGILAALRSLKTKSVIGLMITASHNKVSDNGVKIADPSGGMLTQDWEPFADALANASDPGDLVRLIIEFVKKEDIHFEGVCPAEVLLGRTQGPVADLSLKLQNSLIVGAIALDMGVLTTPQLHWMVRARNKSMKTSEVDYFEQLSSSFRCLMDLIPKGSKINEMDDKLIVDGANGVGGEKLAGIKKMFNSLVIDVRNSGKEGGVLNEGVGADYVQKEKVVPCGFGASDVGLRCASLDGDADRLVYFLVLPKDNNIDLVDGDKIFEQLAILNTNRNEKINNYYHACLGVLKKQGLEVLFTPTGVKYLHEKAAEFDIGIYFEANGHGTILFSEEFLCWLEARDNELSSMSKGSEQQKAALRLLAVSKLINQAVGDALSGLLLVKVVDRTAVVTANAETVVVKPLGLQEAINAEIGTEDIIRVYAEASTQDAADSLGNSVARLVDKFLGFGSSS
ncbi:hypothetical protein PVL29_017059 [Vitis rotundifolia]|uniref:phosphoacetylglucosamine mutase n=1 Tax=Vitis rotundifolia TaxID=103349 RepID=A0AA38Z9G0_VITRO|nr:hypothetical protein PVL29_017059 [Vitis rotundifolia]